MAAFVVHRAEERPIQAVDGVVHWPGLRSDHASLYEEFGVSVSDDTVYRVLKDLNFRTDSPGAC
jgi:hypothetical protein